MTEFPLQKDTKQRNTDCFWEHHCFKAEVPNCYVSKDFTSLIIFTTFSNSKNIFEILLTTFHSLTFSLNHVRSAKAALSQWRQRICRWVESRREAGFWVCRKENEKHPLFLWDWIHTHLNPTAINLSGCILNLFTWRCCSYSSISYCFGRKICNHLNIFLVFTGIFITESGFCG